MLTSLRVRNACVLDAETGEKTTTDIYVDHGVVSEMDPDIRREAVCTLDASDLIVVPGLVDTHVHLYHDTEFFGIDPHRYHLPKGVTYVIDQGSAGADNYEDFRRRALFRTDIGYKSFLNCSRVGMPLAAIEGLGELANPDDFDRDAFIATFTRHRDELLGIKIRLTPNICPTDPLGMLEKALGIADELGVPLVLHPNHAEMTTEEIMVRLRPGDVYTHTFNNSATGILDDGGEVKQSVLEARGRGVIFDTAHGLSSLAFPVLRRALGCGFYPDTISTDLHNANIDGPVFDMPTTISKFLCLGVSLEEAVRMTLTRPVSIFGLADKATTIAPGNRADIAAFRLREGNFVYVDAEGNTIEGGFKLEPVFTVLGERLYMA